MKISEYGDLTPRQLSIIAEEYEIEKQNQREDMLTSAYLTAYWYRIKKLPSLKNVIEKAKPKKQERQSPEQMFAAVKQLHVQLSGEEG